MCVDTSLDMLTTITTEGQETSIDSRDERHGNGYRPASLTRAPRRLTVGSLFSGMGGMLGGAVDADFKAVWATDIEPTCCATLEHRFPNTRVLEKPIQELTVEGDELTPVDLLMAGFPCQSFSIGGRQLGFDDARGIAVFEIIRLLREWGSSRPPVIILENVPNLRNGGDGEWIAEIGSKLRKAGYWFRAAYNTTILNTAKLTGIPQDRDRLFMVACSVDSFNGNAFVFPAQSLRPKPIGEFVKRELQAPESTYMDPSNRFTSLIIDAMEATGDKDAVYQIRRYYARPKQDGLCPTLTANMGGGGHNVPFIRDRWGIRRLTVTECAALQGFHDSDSLFPTDISDNARYRMIGNAVSQPVAQLLALEAKRIIREAKVKT